MAHLRRLEICAAVVRAAVRLHKYMCSLSLWDSRDDKNHWTKKDWKEWKEHVPGQYNVNHVALVDPAKIFLPPLHIKLDLMKSFVRAMDLNGRGFLYLKDNDHKFDRL